MSTTTPPTPPGRSAAPPLAEGQRLDQPTFHALYEAAPSDLRAELIEGVVRMPSPLTLDHSDASTPVLFWLFLYARRTPGTQVLDNATVILDRRGEVQPDSALRVRPECGGRTRNQGRYVAGAPELIVEVSRSTREVDLGPKFAAYDRAGALEYVVRSVDPDEVLWHARESGRLVLVPPDADGLYRSRVFPGLWLDPAALIAGDDLVLHAALDRGLATPEHAAFVERLASA